MQNPPPERPGYGQYGAPPTSPMSHLGKSALGNMDANAAGALAYIGILGLILIIIEKENRFVRFHAMQSLLYGVGMSVLIFAFVIILWIVSFVLIMAGAAAGDSAGVLTIIFSLVIMLIWVITVGLLPLLILGGLIFAAVKAYHGEMYKLPIVGHLAERFTRP